MSRDSDNNWIKSNKIFWLNDSDEWILHTVKLPTARSNHLSLFFQEKLYILSGKDNDHLRINTVDIFDPKTGIWTNGPQLIYGYGNLSYIKMYEYNDNLYVSNDSTSTENILILNVDNNSWEMSNNDTITKHVEYIKLPEIPITWTSII